MKIRTQLLFGALFAGAAGLGCVHHHHDGEVAVGVYAGPPPVTYYYDPVYYDRGYYRDGYWYWSGPHGHEYREFRDEHERRERDWHDHGRPQRNDRGRHDRDRDRR